MIRAESRGESEGLWGCKEFGLGSGLGMGMGGGCGGADRVGDGAGCGEEG